MRTTRTPHPHPRRGAALAVLLAGVLATGAVTSCAGGDEADPRERTERHEGAVTTEQRDTTTTAPDTTEAETPTTVADDEQDPWTVTASQLVFDGAMTASLTCPAGGSLAATVWGDGTYTDDSAVCVAAVHAGVITAADGGEVFITQLEGRDSYDGSEANGVTTEAYGPWGASFEFVPGDCAGGDGRPC